MKIEIDEKDLLWLYLMVKDLDLEDEEKSYDQRYDQDAILDNIERLAGWERERAAKFTWDDYLRDLEVIH